jgi:iron complex transport system ATP-binding protein
MLSAADAWFGYDEEKPVLRGVSVSVPRGGIVGILGPNGSGKTTLLRLLAGTRQPQRGDVTLDGTALSTLPRAALARRMAVVPQETHLAFDYTVAEVAMMGRYAHLGPFEIEGPADLAVVDEALASTGTLELRDRPFGTLSGGEKQRVVIAAALAQIFRLKSTFRLKAEATQDSNEGRGSFRLQPEEASGYLLLDEPTASLDLGYQLEVADLLTRLHDERGVAIVISTHDLALAGALCERVLLIRDGTVVAEGTVDDALTRENVRSVYGVDVDVLRHPSGRRVLVPIGRSGRA